MNILMIIAFLIAIVFFVAHLNLEKFNISVLFGVLSVIIGVILLIVASSKSSTNNNTEIKPSETIISYNTGWKVDTLHIEGDTVRMDKDNIYFN